MEGRLLPYKNAGTSTGNDDRNYADTLWETQPRLGCRRTYYIPESRIKSTARLLTCKGVRSTYARGGPWGNRSGTALIRHCYWTQVDIRQKCVRLRDTPGFLQNRHGPRSSSCSVYGCHFTRRHMRILVYACF